MRRMNTYRNRDFAISIASRTHGEFIDNTFEDNIGNYWVVIWQ